jgi:DNA-binding CsgD family transcriptional regulator
MPTATSRPTFARSSLSPPGMEDRARLGGRGGLVAATRIGVAGATLNGVATVGAVQGTEVTAREAEVLVLIARHLTNAQIADALFISQRTVESHVSAMLRKLQLPDRRSLARHAATVSGLSADPGRRALPVPVTPFVGRIAERAALAAALAGHRMVTATGPGGVGKTRLALSVAVGISACLQGDSPCSEGGTSSCARSPGLIWNRCTSGS